MRLSGCDGRGKGWFWEKPWSSGSTQVGMEQLHPWEVRREAQSVGFCAENVPLAPSVGWCLQVRASLVPLENPCNGEGLVAMCEIKLNGRNSPTALVFLTGCQVSCGSGERQGEGRASPRVKKGKKKE